jgi:hypothetical protein
MKSIGMTVDLLQIAALCLRALPAKCRSDSAQAEASLPQDFYETRQTPGDRPPQ